jgi:hypothetical protein
MRPPTPIGFACLRDLLTRAEARASRRREPFSPAKVPVRRAGASAKAGRGRDCGIEEDRR